MKHIANSKSESPSFITLPQQNDKDITILEYLQNRFPHIEAQTWSDRIDNGQIHTDRGAGITRNTKYRAGMKLSYFREIQYEVIIPFKETIIFQNDHLIVVCKPHFLPVQPAGPYVAECLLNRLKKSLGKIELVPLHRIDRETAGIVLLSANPASRSVYHKLFEERKIKKVYEAIGTIPENRLLDHWLVENRIVESDNWPLMKNANGPINARTIIQKIAEQDNLAKFNIEPLTGKGHQIRLHLQMIGSSILNDRYHPTLQPEKPDDFRNPLQLLARQLSFIDPITGEFLEFTSSRQLLF
jgi:tRNA pseudouridine32 synthase / 23S rRNA pseudouridine746 synthase